uniref:UPF0348 protein lp_1534 n=1 Tax=Anthurium amnicola TaxID=1678845 RepID=A0A1D1XMD1_9ARAE
MDLSFVEPLIVGDRKIAIYEDGDFSESESYLKNAIVACIVGLRPAFKPLLSYIHERWRPKGDVSLHILSNGFFMCHFVLEEDLHRVLNGFWTLRGRPLVVQRWCDGISLEKLSLEELPIWVEFPTVPFHMWSNATFSKLGSLIGSPLYMEASTCRRSKFSNPRICVRVKADQALPEEIHYQDKSGAEISFKVSYP